MLTWMSPSVEVEKEGKRNCQVFVPPPTAGYCALASAEI